MLITNMIWKQLSHTNYLIMIKRWLYIWIYINVQSINLFKQSQVFGYTLYLLSNKKPWSYLQCRQINEKCFWKHGRHKAIEILCCESKNLKDKVIHLLKVTRISWSLNTALICVAFPTNRFQHKHFDIFAVISSLPIHLCT